MPAGRPKKPTELKKLHGTARGDRINENAPVVRITAPPRPSFLDNDPQACELYDAVVDVLMRMGVTAESDSVALSLLADQLSLYLNCRAAVRLDGMTIATENGSMKTHPLLPSMHQAFTNISKLLGQYGLTAATRDNVNAQVPTEGTAEEQFDAFLNKRK